MAERQALCRRDKKAGRFAGALDHPFGGIQARQPAARRSVRTPVRGCHAAGQSLDATLALHAAALGLRHKLPLADSIVYATARAGDALVWTQDADFEGLPGVKFWRKGN